jgi:hypothetical protein
MTTHTEPRLVPALRSASRATSGTAILAGGLVLVGWMLDIPTLKSILPNLVTMRTNTALGFIPAGVATMAYDVYAEAVVGIARARADSLAPPRSPAGAAARGSSGG